MSSYNRTITVGRLTRDPDVSYVGEDSGTAVCKMGIAVNYKYKDKEEVCFLDVVIFGAQAEACGKYLEKGREVLFEGRLRQDRWEKDGQKCSKIYLHADRAVFIGSPSS